MKKEPQAALFSCVYKLSHNYFYAVFGFTLLIRDHTSLDRLAVNGDALDALLYVVGIRYLNVVSTFAELSCQLEVTEILRYAGINGQTLMCRIKSQNILGNIYSLTIQKMLTLTKKRLVVCGLNASS